MVASAQQITTSSALEAELEELYQAICPSDGIEPAQCYFRTGSFDYNQGL